MDSGTARDSDGHVFKGIKRVSTMRWAGACMRSLNVVAVRSAVKTPPHREIHEGGPIISNAPAV